MSRWQASPRRGHEVRLGDVGRVVLELKECINIDEDPDAKGSNMQAWGVGTRATMWESRRGHEKASIAHGIQRMVSLQRSP
jgi:hypothetical protein